jgi:undecaprenyl diphosphate synthase
MTASRDEASPTLPPLLRAPRHIAIIMDGNGRWAQARGLPRPAGHRAGTENLRQVIQATVEFGVQVLTIYAFSTENWNRPATEVRALLQLVRHVLDTELAKLHENGVRVRHIGRVQGLPDDLVARIREAEAVTAHNTVLQLNVALNYGGRAELVDAVRRIQAEGLPPEAISEQTLAERLYTAGLPDPDLVIRTAGEMRLSNFLIWQAAYAEYYSTPVYWPDFGREALYAALVAYQARGRRFGRVTVSSP